MLHTSITSIILFLALSVLNGQNELYEIEYLNQKDGLSNRFCRQLIEDNYGNIWIATSDGLNKYDGFQFEVFDNTNSRILKQHIDKIIMDPNGNIWIIQNIRRVPNASNLFNFLDHEYYVSVYHAQTNEILSLQEYLKGYGTLNTENIKEIVSGNGELFLRMESTEIVLFKDKLQSIVSKIEKGQFLGRAGPNTYYLWNKNVIQIINSSNEVLASFDTSHLPHALYFSPIDSNKLLVFQNSTAKIKPFEITPNGISKNAYLETLEFQSEKYFPNIIDLHKSMNLKKHIRFIDNVYINGSSESICNIVPKLDAKIYSSLLSDSGIIYLGTTDGIIVISITQKVFNRLLYNEDVHSGFRGLIITDSLVLANNYINEVFEIKNKNTLSIVNKYLRPNGVNYYLDPKNKSHLWTTYHSYKIRRIDLSSDEMVLYSGGQDEYASNFAILRSRATGKLYFGGDSGLLTLDEQIDSIVNISLDLDSKIILAIKQILEYDSLLWLATNKGIVSYDEFKHEATLYNSSNSPLEYENINYLHFDKDFPEIVWIATQGNGLHKWNMSSSEYDVFDMEFGISNNDVHCIYQDSDSYLWLTTNNKLNRFNPYQKSNEIFTISHGAADDEYNLFSHYEDENGYLYFGGLHGITYFHPDSVNAQTAQNINIRCIESKVTEMSGQIYDNTMEIITSSRLLISHNQLSTQLRFTTNRLFKSKELSFQYKISGLDNNWNSMNGNSLRLSNLPYGSFELIVRLNPNHSSLQSKAFVLNLEVIKPFYKTFAFYFLSFLSMVFIVAMILWYRMRSIKQQNDQLENLVQLRTDELKRSNETKNKLFTILAHDLKNPISSFNNIVDKIRFLIKDNRITELNELTDEIKHKINGLDQNLNNLLHWALVEEGEIPFKPKIFKVKSIIDSVILLYSDPIKEKNITIKNLIDEEDIVFADEIAIQTIFRNLLQNAAKFCFLNTIITIDYTTQKGNTAIISIQNIGQDIKHNKANDKGLGLGLIIVNELAHLNHGKIKLETQKDGITTIAQLILPLKP